MLPGLLLEEPLAGNCGAKTTQVGYRNQSVLLSSLKFTHTIDADRET